MITRKLLTTAVALATLPMSVFTRCAPDDGHHAPRRNDLVGLPLALTGPAGQIRGINGGGAAWSIGRASADVKPSGKVSVAFEDLIFSSGPNAGKNTLPSMRVVVSCLGADGATVNAATEPFAVTTATAADPGGDGQINAQLTIPSPCLAPIVFVTNAAGNAWFAVDDL